MKAQVARFAVWACFAALAVLVWFKVQGWASWLALIVIPAIGGTLAERIFRRLATPEDIRVDLEDRVRNPPL